MVVLEFRRWGDCAAQGHRKPEAQERTRYDLYHMLIPQKVDFLGVEGGLTEELSSWEPGLDIEPEEFPTIGGHLGLGKHVSDDHI